MTITLVHISGAVFFGLTALSFYVQDILLLRSTVILSGLVGIYYSYNIAANPLWLSILGIICLIGINLVRIVNIFLERRKIALNEEDNELYETMFSQFTPLEFLKLMRVGEWRDAEPGTVLAVEGEELDDLKLIYNGEVAVERAGQEIAHSRDGTLIGEMSFLKGGAATASVHTVQPTRYVAWPKESLRKLLKRNPNMDMAMKTVFSLDLAGKLGAGKPGTG